MYAPYFYLFDTISKILSDTIILSTKYKTSKCTIQNPWSKW